MVKRITTPDTPWREVFSAWARTRLPEKAFRVMLHDQNLLAPALAQVLQNRQESVLIVASDQGNAERLASQVSVYLNMLEDRRMLVPVDELHLKNNQWVPENDSDRCAALDTALMGQKAVYFSTPQALLSSCLSPKYFKKKQLHLKKGQTIPMEELCRQLMELDYDNEYQIQQPGEFAHRGGILDIYSPLYDVPARLEFWGDEIDSIRWFMPDTQRSFKEVDEITVIPRGIAVSEAAELEQGIVLDYFDDDIPLVLCSPDEIDQHLREYATPETAEEWKKIVDSASGVIRLVTSPNDDIQKTRAGGAAVRLDAVSLDGELSGLISEMGESAVLWHWQQLRDSLLRWQRMGYTIAAFCAGDGGWERFRELVDGDDATRGMKIAQEKLELQGGMLFPDARLVLLSERELFGRKEVRRRKRQIDYKRDMAVRDSTELEEGVYAVHVTHGICIYHGVRFMETGHEMQEVIELEFADNARLYVPLDQAILISRYMGASKSTPSLSKIGGNAWKNTKAAAGDAAMDLAADLLKVEAMRQSASGVAYQPSIEWERAFAGSFPYHETPDQEAAIQAVLEDMGKDKPMDRLLCGDVGFGKTEVAMRAAFRAVMNGKQVAVLVPTTILAQQHYESFRERMSAFPITVEMLSRFRTHKEQSDVLDRTVRGEVDILIGTHRLLSSDVSFANLGLLIIDEEQRFGVKAKQRLKELRSNLDILTMTATPIPRTLYFSLSGIRNLSTIMTPPVNRFPVKTIVGSFDKELIRQAILNELERHGQVYILHNRVQTIDKFGTMVSELVPQARIVVAHGQMSATTLESIMLKFVKHEFDVLICTTIIESGVDIPNTNTIIIDRADRFGLSELYQLRGRVGRTDRQAYAYLLLPPMGVLPSNARERMEAIRRYTHLGAGFKLAMRDLEIRGAGNILGTEQSGHITAVGFELYCQLLKEAVAQLEHRESTTPRPVEIILDRATMALNATEGRTAMGIPSAYVKEQPVRVECYKDLARMMTVSEVDAYQNDLRDRFGKLPDCTLALLDYTRIRILAQKRRIARINVRERRLVVELPDGLMRDKHGSIPTLSSNVGSEQLKEIMEVLR